MDYLQTTKVDKVTLKDRFNPSFENNGTLHLTATHLIFINPAVNPELWLSYSHIATVEKQQISIKGAPLKIVCKDFRVLNFVFYKERDCQDVYVSLQNLTKPVNYAELHAFTYEPPGSKWPRSDGWNIFEFEAEMTRLEVPSDLWRKTDINKDYKLCPTYPEVLYVPATATEETLTGSASFRSRGRLPVLTYYHKYNKTALCRSSQPLTGMRGRSVDDEQLLQAVIQSNPKSPVMYIVDTRPKINAMANKAAGKGYENLDNYPNVLYRFRGIQNIHVMRESLQKLSEVIENPALNAGEFFDSLDSSSWLKHIRSVIDTSRFIALAMLMDNASVLCHCSDGWDRTAQTCALASLFLDPYYRTIKGYQILIEKDWLAFGHKFNCRCGLLRRENREVSPVFTQFIDCTWQIMQQFPFAFEFNEQFLLTIHDHVYSCQFGNFLGNCQQDRRKESLSEKTYSLWGYMCKQLATYLNPYYDPNFNADKRGIIIPLINPQCIRFWSGMYNRHAFAHSKSETIEDRATRIYADNKKLEKEISAISEEIALLENKSAEGQVNGSICENPEDEDENSNLQLNHDLKTMDSSTTEIDVQQATEIVDSNTLSEFEQLAVQDSISDGNEVKNTEMTKDVNYTISDEA
ncbi:uncharacterized protein TRIADDRAFT_56124 [Trichoplax adhaerens]|uniref:Myotubularin phosphatase domain-containing protein n=1 Tax=Trichoplax adhaerens TaxID=10228 RepID=B3RX90_TRIAD|nr:hypothetical protein TRIADDRAFT_56124 [Trichoplax adhaerens]EDV24375.1 hypothetical protein TRIADDRAFT_56124 [Trichoplax adhaerens]|eukprot:XP_002112265.1 hypothetical protein TRIADDRAFT_56124 [Trichoplax adhaerens]